MECKWCGKEIKGWYLRYDDNVFCREKDDLCLKNFLFEEHDSEIGMDKVVDEYYDMSEVDGEVL